MGKTSEQTGASAKKICGAMYACIDMQKYFGGSATIEHVAKKLILQESTVLYGLLDNGANFEAVREMYGQAVEGGKWDGNIETYYLARRELVSRSTNITCVENCRVPTNQVPTFHTWLVPAMPVCVPLSSSVKAFLARADKQAEDKERRARLKVVRHDFDRLRRQLTWLENKVENLVQYEATFRDSVVRHAGADLLYLKQAEGILGNMLQFPRTGPNNLIESEAAHARVRKLREELYEFIDLANEHLLENPPENYGGVTVRNRREVASEVLMALRSQPSAGCDLERDPESTACLFHDFADNVEKLTRHPDLDPKLMDQTCAVMASAYRAIVKTEVADECLKDIEGALDLLASKEFITQDLGASDNSSFDTALRSPPVAPEPNSALLHLVQLVAAVGPNAIGNAPGPKSLSVVVMEIAGASFLRSVALNPTAAGTLAGKLYRGIVNAAQLNRDGRVTLLQALLKPERGGYSKAQALLTTKTMTNPKWVAIGGVFNLVNLVLAIQRDPQTTVQKWSHIADLISISSASASTALRGFKSLLQAHHQKVFKFRASLAGVAGVAGIVSGALAAYSEFDDGDEPAAWVAIGGAAGGAMTFACWLMGVGIGTSEFGVGLFLLVAGLVLSIGSALYGTIRGVSGSHVVYESCLLAFGYREANTHAAGVMSERPELQEAYERLKQEHHRFIDDFWPVDPERTEHLRNDLEFHPRDVAQITGEDYTPPTGGTGAGGAGNVPSTGGQQGAGGGSGQ